MADRRGAVAKKTQQRRSALEDPQTHTDFSYNLDACVVQGSRDDRDATPTGPGVVERVWITSRPPRVGRGVEPTVSARRAYVMLSHVQGQMIDTGEVVCKRVCAPFGGGQDDKPAVNAAAAAATYPQSKACNARGHACNV